MQLKGFRIMRTFTVLSTGSENSLIFVINVTNIAIKGSDFMRRTHKI